MAAQELCEVLSMGTEDTLAGFNANEFVPAVCCIDSSTKQYIDACFIKLLELMKMDYNPEMMILACRGICNMVEALPGTSPVIIEHGAVPVIITKLLSIEYIDLAEQCLTTLEKLSVENPVPILRANGKHFVPPTVSFFLRTNTHTHTHKGLSAILSFLDFFSLAVQRSAVTTASNLCRRVPRDCFQYVSDSIPTLTQLLKYTDQKILEKVVLCFARLVDNYFTNTDILLQLSAHGLMKNLVHFLKRLIVRLHFFFFLLLLDRSHHSRIPNFCSDIHDDGAHSYDALQRLSFAGPGTSRDKHFLCPA